MSLRRRGHLSSHRRKMLGVTIALLDERGKELQEESCILEKNKKPFLQEYRKICRKYKCFISGNLIGISAQRKDEKIYTITSHLRKLK